MGRSRKASGGGGIVILFLAAIGLIIQYWQYVAAAAGVFLLIYLIVQSSKKSSRIQQGRSIPVGKGPRPEITISFGVSPAQAGRRPAKHNARFYDAEELIQIRGFSIPAYLLYVGESPETLPHLVRPSLPVGRPGPDQSTRMGYWPDYESISDQHRANYLAWLSTGRSDSNVDIGIVFIYFYGLEYRALFEKADQKKILFELARLYEIYGTRNSSFRSYSWHFIRLLVLTTTNFTDSEKSRLEDFFKSPHLHLQQPPANISELQSHLRNQGRPDWSALYDLVTAKGVSPILADQNARAHHRRLFEELGPKVIGPVEELTGLSSKTVPCTYKTATSLHLNLVFALKHYATTSALTKKLKSLWSIATLALIESWIGPATSEAADRIIKIDSIADHVCDKQSKSIGVRDARTIAALLESAELALEPDPRLTGRGYKRGDDLIIYKPTAEGVACDPERYRTASLLLDLGIQVCSAGGSIDPQEIQTIQNFLGAGFLKTDSERERISKRARLVSSNQTVSSGLAKKLGERLASRECEAVGQYLISVAAADGIIQPGESKALTKIFKDLRLPQERLDSILAGLSIGAQFSPVSLRQDGGVKRKGSTIPAAPKTENTARPTSGQDGGVALDPKRLKQILSDTAEVAEILSKTFTTEEKEAYVAPVVSLPSSEGLDDAHSRFVSLLISKDEWNPEELRDQAKTLGLMLSGAIAKINEWSDQEYGEFLIDEGDTYKVHRGLLNSKKGGLSSA